MADPIVIQCSQACTVAVELRIPGLDLSVQDAMTIGFGIVAVWAVALFWAEIARAVDARNERNED